MSGFGHVRGSYCLDDGAKWAAEFKRVVLDRNIKVDEGLMLGWFCNAIEIAHDHRTDEPNGVSPASEEVEEEVDDFEKTWDLGFAAGVAHQKGWEKLSQPTDEPEPFEPRTYCHRKTHLCLTVVSQEGDDRFFDERNPEEWCRKV
jgi:hypothetical protein